MSARLRQAVIAARDLDAAVTRLREGLGLGEPFSDPAVGYFGLRNAVFALGDTFLEVISPIRDGTSAGRLLERRGGDCGYMLMLQVGDLAGARAAAQRIGLREVFAVELEDMDEVHLHPADIGAAIVSLSQPKPPSSWRWGGPDWEARGAPLRVVGATVAVENVEAVDRCWRQIAGEVPGIQLIEDVEEPRLSEIVIEGAPQTIEFERVRVRPYE